MLRMLAHGELARIHHGDVAFGRHVAGHHGGVVRAADLAAHAKADHGVGARIERGLVGFGELARGRRRGRRQLALAVHARKELRVVNVNARGQHLVAKVHVDGHLVDAVPRGDTRGQAGVGVGDDGDGWHGVLSNNPGMGRPQSRLSG